MRARKEGLRGSWPGITAGFRCTGEQHGRGTDLPGGVVLSARRGGRASARLRAPTGGDGRGAGCVAEREWRLLRGMGRAGGERAMGERGKGWAAG